MASASDPPPALDDALPDWMTAFQWHVVRQHSQHGLSRAGCEDMLRFANDVLLPASGSTAKGPVRFPTLRRHLGLDRDHLVRYLVCPRPACSSLSPPIPTAWPSPTSSASPPPAASCIRCDEPLQRDGPVFLYHPLEAWLRGLVQRPEVREALESWRARPTPSTLFADATPPLADVYDGEMWHQEQAFLNSGKPGDINLLVSLSTDWFRPFNYTAASYSCGPVVLSVLNLPSALRFKPEYQHLAGVIPGPSEPSWSMCSRFLEPLVAELQRLLDGIEIGLPAPPPSTASPDTTAVAATLRAKLVLFVGDSPARTKVCGFNPLTVNEATCPYCDTDKDEFQELAATSAKTTPRDPDRHRQDALAVKGSSDAHHRNAAATTGARYSALYELPYWRSVTSAPVDVMHAVYLGVVRRVWHKILIDRGLLTSREVVAVQARIRATVVPSTLAKLSVHFGDAAGGSPTAAQYATLARLLPALLHGVWHDAIDDYRRHRRTIRHDMEKGAWIEEGDPDAEHWAWLTHSAQAEAEAIRTRTTTHAAHWVHKGWFFREIVVRLGLIVDYLHQQVLTDADVDTVTLHLRRLHRALAVISPIYYNSHILSHLGPQLRRFGPPRAFWAFGIEKAIQVLSRTTVPTNKKHGQVELSLLKTWSDRGRAEAVNGPAEQRQEGIALASRTRDRQRTHDSSVLKLETAPASRRPTPLDDHAYDGFVALLRTLHPRRRFVKTSIIAAPDAVEVSRAVHTHASISVNGLYFRASHNDVHSAPGDSFGFIKWPSTSTDVTLVQVTQIISYRHRARPSQPVETPADDITAVCVVCRLFPPPTQLDCFDLGTSKPFARPSSVQLEVTGTAVFPATALVAHAAITPVPRSEHALVKIIN
ncbi:uncharacterized protein PFL1_00837 [Pseudozyma flocculosa PF-1]|uniref:Transposase domain-containing protein n=1 Tax=Pseudozyma flocculosa TaxID=84751 RepID=A0A5C3F5L6_9BASI|nr:uncharacterized protein PFL1_00837 [Pseudozyma flocculosa PF-1]EPQ31504.1 hypothetical protein PFL1_00837 [Pseudozyma flocculosa PF-1]SPO38709.1 uncharacterized protein PSFLO_04188 [Pseudozyma flocculosa]